MSEFGLNFKSVRESKNLSLDDIAAETRINARFLKAIEEENLEVLPGGIVGRGFVRTYATFLGLDPDQTVGEFEKRSTYKEPPLAEGFRTSAVQPGKANRNYYPIAAGGLVLLIAIFYIVTRESPSAVVANQTAATKAAAARQPAASPKAVSATDTAPPTDSVPRSEVPADDAKAASAPPAESRRLAETTAAVPESAGDKALVVEFKAHEETWIRVDADGVSVAVSLTLHPGETRRYSADKSITFVVGNAGGVAVRVNGHELPSLGTTGQVRIKTITPETLKDIVP